MRVPKTTKKTLRKTSRVPEGYLKVTLSFLVKADYAAEAIRRIRELLEEINSKPESQKTLEQFLKEN